MVSGEEASFNYFQDDVEGPAVEFLDAGTGPGGDDPFGVGETGEFAAAASGEGDGGQVARFGGFEGEEEVGGVAAGGEKDEDIAGLAEGLDLAGEDAVEAETKLFAGDFAGPDGRSEVRRQAALVALELLLPPAN